MCYLWYCDFVGMLLFMMVVIAYMMCVVIISEAVAWCLDMRKLYNERSIAAHDAYWKSPRGMFANYIMPPFLFLPFVLYLFLWMWEFLALASTSRRRRTNPWRESRPRLSLPAQRPWTRSTAAVVAPGA